MQSREKVGHTRRRPREGVLQTPCYADIRTPNTVVQVIWQDMAYAEQRYRLDLIFCAVPDPREGPQPGCAQTPTYTEYHRAGVGGRYPLLSHNITKPAGAPGGTYMVCVTTKNEVYATGNADRVCPGYTVYLP